MFVFLKLNCVHIHLISIDLNAKRLVPFGLVIGNRISVNAFLRNCYEKQKLNCEEEKERKEKRMN